MQSNHFAWNHSHPAPCVRRNAYPVHNPGTNSILAACLGSGFRRSDKACIRDISLLASWSHCRKSVARGLAPPPGQYAPNAERGK